MNREWTWHAWILSTLAMSTVCGMLGLVVGILAFHGGPTTRDACRAEIEQANRAYQNDQIELARDLLMDALIVTCLTEYEE